MSLGWVFLAASVAGYGVANFLQSVAAARVSVHSKLDPGLLLKLAGHRIYVAGLLCQLAAFAFAFFARRDLPLFLVQTAVAAGLGVTVLLGVALLHWRHPASEVVLLGTLVLGLTALIISAEVSQSRPLNGPEVAALALSVPAVGLLGRLGVKLHGAPGSVALGALSGLSFGAVAIASRPLAGAHSFSAFVTDPLLYILLAHTVVGQLLLGLAMQRGSTTAAVAAMDAAAAIPPALVGLLLLGDRIAPGRGWLAAIGFVLALGSVLLLSRYAEPQHHVREKYEGKERRRCAPGATGAGTRRTTDAGRGPDAHRVTESEPGTGSAPEASAEDGRTSEARRTSSETGPAADAPPRSVPQNGVPQNGVAQNGVPQNGLPQNGVPAGTNGGAGANRRTHVQTGRASAR